MLNPPLLSFTIKIVPPLLSPSPNPPTPQLIPTMTRLLLAFLFLSLSSFTLSTSFLPSPPSHLPSSLRAGANQAGLSQAERTYIMIKPDGVQRNIVGNIISRFEAKGFKLVALKTRQATKELLEEHYKDLVDKPFFPKMRDYMLSGPVVSMVWEGTAAVSTGRMMLGATNPLQSNPGTIRGDYCLEVGRNICHGSDSIDNANKEIGLWFSPDEILEWDSHSFEWIYE